MIDLVPNITLLYQWILFFVAFLSLHFFVFKPTLKIIEARKEKTQGSKDTAESLVKETEEMAALCEKKMEEARLVGIRKKIEKMEVGEKFREELLKKIKSDVDQKMDEIRTRIAEETKQATTKLQSYSQDLARSITSKILEREV